MTAQETNLRKGLGYDDYADNQERARQFPVGKQSPMRKVPGFSQKSAKWDAYLGRWVIYRRVQVR